MPLYLELLSGVKKILKKDGMLSDEERRRIKDLEEKLEILIKGEYVGHTRNEGRCAFLNIEC